MFAHHPMPFGHVPLSAFYPGTSHGSIWNHSDHDLFDLMYQHMGGAMCHGEQVGSCRGQTCSRSRAQHQDALRRRAEMVRREEQRRLQEQRRIQQERKRALAQRRKRNASKHAKVLVLEDDPQDHITIGVILKHAVSPEDLSLDSRGRTLRVTQYKRIPVYQYGRDMWGMPIVQQHGYKKEKVWSEVIEIDPAINVSEYSAHLQDHVLVVTMPYHAAGADQPERVPIHADEATTSEEDSEQPDVPCDMETISHSDSKIKDNETISSVHDDDGEEDGEEVLKEAHSPKSIKDMWEEMDGSIEDCEY